MQFVTKQVSGYNAGNTENCNVECDSFTSTKHPQVCVFITAGPITKLFAGGAGSEWTTCAMIDDEPRPVWMSPFIGLRTCHALANTGGREIVGKKEGEQKGCARGSVHWGCYYATALDIEVDPQGCGLETASPTLLSIQYSVIVHPR